MTPIAAYGYLVFNLLCAPCFAAMGAIKREMNNQSGSGLLSDTSVYLLYHSMCIYQIGTLVRWERLDLEQLLLFIFVIGFIYLLFRKG